MDDFEPLCGPLYKVFLYLVWFGIDRRQPQPYSGCRSKDRNPPYKGGQKKKRFRGAKRKLAKPKKKQRIRKRPKKVKEENDNEPMAEALPPLNDAELMD